MTRWDRMGAGLLALCACGSPAAAPSNLAPARRPAAATTTLEPTAQHGLVAVLQFWTCGLASDGRIQCWHGQDAPRAIPPLPAGERVVALGGGDDDDRLCALTERSAFCWNLEQKREGSLPPPERFVGLERPTDLDISEDHGCAVDGYRARCWSHDEGEPRDVGVKNAVAVWLHEAEACTLDRKGAVWCWTEPDGVATQVPGLPPAARLSEGDDPCAVLQDGRVACWERASFLPSGYAEPVILEGVNDAVGFGSRGTTFCVLHRDGVVSCGGGNHYGMLGNGTMDPGPLRPVAGLSGITELVVNDLQVCARDDAGRTWCWGGLSSYRDPTAPTHVDAPHRIEGLQARTISAGRQHSCAIDVDGEVWCWGDENIVAEAELSDPPLRASWDDKVGPEGWIAKPQRLAAVRATSLASSGFTCTVTPEERVRCWGGYDVEQVNEALADIPAKWVATGFGYACAVDARGGMRCAGGAEWRRPANACTPAHFPAWTPMLDGAELRGWSHSYRHLCGLGNERVVCFVRAWQQGTTKVPCDQYARYELALELVAVDATEGHACGIGRDGRVRCWEVARPTPIEVRGLGDARQLGVGKVGGCALDGAGAVRCWDMEALTAEPIAGLPAVAEISVGYEHVCARHADGRLWCWGDNQHGQVGAGNRERKHRVVPTRIVELGP